MPLPFTLALVAVTVALFAARVLARGLPLGTRTRPFTPVDLVVVAIGTLGLLLHCTAMFSRDIIAGIPGATEYIAVVNGMGAGSVILYVVPSLVVLAGLRRQQPVVVALLGLTFVAVGITMYDHGPLNTHLAAIFVSGTWLAVTLALFVALPGRSPARRSRRT